MNPKISIVTVCYNAVSTIEETILSVVNQSYPNLEYIIIDGGSTDGTTDIIKKYKEKIACFVSEPDNGIYDAMNKGIDRATGEWINFRNVGDPFTAVDVISCIFREPVGGDVSFLLGDCYHYNDWGYKRYKPDILQFSYKERMPVLHAATFVRTQLHKKRKFDLKYRSSADYDFFYECFEKGCKYEYRPIVVANFNSVGFSTINRKRAFMEDGEITGRSINGFCFTLKYAYIAVRAFIGTNIILKLPPLRELKYKKMKKEGWKELPIVNEEIE